MCVYPCSPMCVCRSVTRMACSIPSLMGTHASEHRTRLEHAYPCPFVHVQQPGDEEKEASHLRGPRARPRSIIAEPSLQYDSTLVAVAAPSVREPGNGGLGGAPTEFCAASPFPQNPNRRLGAGDPRHWKDPRRRRLGAGEKACLSAGFSPPNPWREAGE